MEDNLSDGMKKINARYYVVVVVVVVVAADVVVFALNRPFYPTTSAVTPVSFLILHPREMRIL